MTRPLALLLPLAALAVACEPLEDTGGEECYGHWTEPATAQVDAGRREPGGVAFAVAPTVDLPGTTLVSGVGLDVRVSNLDPDADCGVAVYVSDAPPTRGSLPEIADGESPAAEIEGLGARVASVALARAAAQSPDSEVVQLQLPADRASYVTVAACAGAALEVWAEATVELCTTDWEAIPESVAPVGVLW